MISNVLDLEIGYQTPPRSQHQSSKELSLGGLALVIISACWKWTHADWVDELVACVSMEGNLGSYADNATCIDTVGVPR